MRSKPEQIKTGSAAKTAAAAIIINIVILAVLLIAFYPVFETNDDAGLEALVTGARGVRDPHMVYSNYLLGLVLTGLFKAWPAVQWTGILQYAFLFCSFTLSTYVIFRKNSCIGVRLLTVAVICFFAYEGYICLQYTKTAGIMTAAGLLAVFHGLLEEKVAKVPLILGAFLTISGSLYRVQQSVSEIAIFSVMVIYLIVTLASEHEKPTKRIAWSIVFGLALLVVIGGLRVYDRAQYKDAEWAAYLEYDKYRAEMIDYGVPKYSEHEEEYNALGIDKTAYDLMKSWTFQDDERFTADTFRQIAEMREAKTVNKAFIKNYVKDLAHGLLNEVCFLCFALVAIGWLISGLHKPREWIAVILMALILLAMYFYLYYAGRFMIHRVDAAIWFTASLILLYMYGSGKFANISIVPCLLIAALFVIKVSWADSLRTNAADMIKAAEDEKAVIEMINSDQDHLYLTKVGAVKFSEAYGAFEAIPYQSADNMYPLGGWTAETPAYMQVLKKYGVTNPFREIAGNENIYIVDKKIDKTLAYIKKWYCPDASAELVDEINGHKIYKIINTVN